MKWLSRPAAARMAVSGLAGRHNCASRKAGQRLFSVINQPALRQSNPSAGQKLDYETLRGRPKRTTGSKTLVAAAVVGSLCYLCYRYCYYDDGQAARGLNGESFARFVVVAREPVSLTAVVLTLQPAPEMSLAAREATRTAIADAWGRRGTWAVEVKQPQLQIAREYTPLPPGSGRGDSDGTTIRLFVRIVPGGEMSRYLVQRKVGDTVSLRGPRAGFAVKQRLGPDGGSVVFLAAGTGIAPALQAADAVLRADDDDDDGSSSRRSSSSAPAASVTILWANRLLQDSEGHDRDRTDESTAAAIPANPIVRDLQAMRHRYGKERVQVHCFADEDRSFITEAVVRESLSLGSPKSGSRDGVWGAWTSSLWPWKQQQQQQQHGQHTPATVTSFVPAADCPYHSAAVLERLAADRDEKSMATTTGGGGGGCSCRVSEGGKQNLVMISGPDGFVSFWAGPKSWAGGEERQGPVGGILGALKSRYAGILDSWTVVKL